MMGTPACLGLLVWLAGLCRAAGGRLLPARLREDASLGGALSWLAGLWLASVLMLGLGSCGWATRGASWALVIAATVVLRRPLAAWFQRLGRLPEWWAELESSDRALVAGAALVWAAALVLALMPPIADALVYQIVLPDWYVRLGRVAPPPMNPYFHFPQATEMLYYLGLLLAGERMAGLINWAIGLLMAASTGGLAAALAGPRAGRVAVLIVSSLPLVVGWSLGPYPEYALMAGTALATAAFLRWWQTGDDAWAVAAGAAAGWAMSVKYTGAALVGLVAGCALARGRPRAAVAAGAAGLAVFAPWALKNVLFTGNPLAPFLGHLLGGPPAVVRFGEVMAFGNGFRGDDLRSVWQWITLPWFLSAAGLENRGGAVPLGPVFAGLAPLVLLGRRLPGWGWVVGLTAALYGFWLLTCHTTRYLAPALPLLAVLCAAGFETWRQRGRAASRVGWAVLAVLISVNAVRVAVQNDWARFLPVALGVGSRESLLEAKLGGCYTAARFLNGTASPGGTVMYFGEDRGYHCRLRYVAPTRYAPHPMVQNLNAAPDAAAVRRWLAEEGIGFLLVNERHFPSLWEWEPANRLSARGARNWSDLKRRWLNLVYEDPPFAVWRLRSPMTGGAS